MVQLIVEFDEVTADAVRKMAAQSNKSDVDVVREAVQSYVSKSQRQRAPIGAGMYDSGQSDLPERTEEILEQAAREGKWR